MNHEFRNMKNAFRKIKLKVTPPPPLYLHYSQGIKFGREFLNYLKLQKLHLLDFLDMVLNIIEPNKAYFGSCRIGRTICYDIILM
ncbi:hypothetical protein RDI58_018148 [Solanum bulbocastanum]|uniref:Uncharacterized protein n=1 Tax=Solanum bulbocastanum TaxID=147425 RepID=A0AAN8YCP3_SOLBU